MLLVAAIAAFALVATRGGSSDSPGRGVATPSNRPVAVTLRELDRELRASVLFARWARSNPGELERYETYAGSLRIGVAMRPPEMVTPLGRALVAAVTATAHAG